LWLTACQSASCQLLLRIFLVAPLIASFPTFFFFAEKPDVFDPEKLWRSRSVTQHTERITTTTKSRLTHVSAEARARNHIHFWRRAAGVVQIKPEIGRLADPLTTHRAETLPLL
jgi:hypothetical protein